MAIYREDFWLKLAKLSLFSFSSASSSSSSYINLAVRMDLGIREVSYFIEVEFSFTSDFMIIGCFWSGSDYCFVRGRDDGIGYNSLCL